MDLSPNKRGCRSVWLSLSFAFPGYDQRFSWEADMLDFHDSYSRTSCRSPWFRYYNILKRLSEYKSMHTAQSHPLPLWILRFECALKTATKMMNCIPWYLPQKNATKPCRFKTDKPKPITESYTCHSSTKTAKFTEEMALVDGASCDCLPDCKTTDYQYSMTSSKLRS